MRKLLNLRKPQHLLALLTSAAVLTISTVSAQTPDALAEARAIFESGPSAETATALARAFAASGMMEEGEAYFSAHPAPSPSTGHGKQAAARAAAAFGRGALLMRQSRWDEVLASSDEARRGFEKAGDRKSLARTLHGMGFVHQRLGHYPKAVAFYEDALALYGELGDAPGQAALLNNISVIHESLGDYAAAMASHQKALALAESAGDEAGAARAMGNMGLIRHRLGDYAGALSFHERSLAMYEKTGDRLGAARVMVNTGLFYHGLGDYARAAECHLRALDTYRKIGDKQGEALALSNLGIVHDGLGDGARAGKFFRESLAIQEQIGDKAGEAISRQNLCLSAAEAGRFEESLVQGDRALELGRALGSTELLQGARDALGFVCAAMRRPAEAAAHYRAAIEAAESMRALLSESGQKSGFFETKLSSYEGLTGALLVRQAGSRKPVASKTDSSLPGSWLLGPGCPAEAFSVAERMRARSFLDEIGAARFAREGVPPEMMEQKRLLEARMKWLEERAAP